jgi:hypothetical protein
MNNVYPQAWLTQTLERIANGWPAANSVIHAVELSSLKGLRSPLTLHLALPAPFLRINPWWVLPEAKSSS